MTIWVQNIKKTHYEIILSTLLPHPPDFAKVGGHWEKLSSRTEQMKEGKYQVHVCLAALSPVSLEGTYMYV